MFTIIAFIIGIISGSIVTLQVHRGILRRQAEADFLELLAISYAHNARAKA